MNSLTVHAYAWTIEDGYTEDDHIAIHVWTLDQQSKPHLIRINDFPAFCHVELPYYVSGLPFDWTEVSADFFYQWICQMMQDHAPEKFLFKRVKKVYYYRGDRDYPMLLLTFKTEEAMKHCERFLSKPWRVEGLGLISCRVWETHISLVRKLLTIRNCKYSQWFRIEVTPVEDSDRISTPGIAEYLGNWRSLTPIPSEESKSWITKPRLLAFDIECYSPNHKAMPNELHAKHVAYMISLIYQEVGNPESRKRFGLIIGDCDQVTLDDTRPGPEGDELLPGDKRVEIIKVKNEIELINKMSELVNELDPEIITGYNILAFDYPYLNARLSRRLKEWQPMGRIANKKTKMVNFTWNSGGYGHHSINYLQMDGRISVDLHPLVRRDYKFDKYTLDFVSKFFLGEHRGKHDVSAQDMFRIYEESTQGKNLDQEEYQRTIGEMTRVMKYCIEDSELVVDLFDRLNVWIALVELSNIVGVEVMDLFTRGQQVRGLSQFYDYAARSGYVLDSRENMPVKFSGGFVYEPIPGLYDNIICLDFASLYPSIIQAYNICPTTLIPPELEDQIPNSDCHVFDFDQEENREDSDDDLKDSPKKVVKKKIHRHYKYIKKDIREGIIPQLVRNLVTERRSVRRVLDGVKDENGEWIVEKEKDPLVRVILDKRQLALKVTANSFFGLLGVQEGGKLPLIEGAMCITAKGRELINMVNNYLQEKYQAIIVYNDSVAEDTPLLLRHRGLLYYRKISDLFHNELIREDGKEECFPTNGGKTRHCEQLGCEKECHIIKDIEVWSDQGWTKIKRVIRHKTNKKMYRVLTPTGCVDVTEDHSLLRPDGKEISPQEIRVGEELLHKSLPSSEIIDLSLEEAWIWGLFFASGSSIIYLTPKGYQISWEISNRYPPLLLRCQKFLEKKYPALTFRIGNYMQSAHCYKLQVSGDEESEFISYYRERFYTQGEKVIPLEILNGKREIKEAFLDGYGKKLPSKLEDFPGKSSNLLGEDKTSSAGLFYLAKACGYPISLNLQDKRDIYQLNLEESKSPMTIKRIIPLRKCRGYVYDLETENHHFGAGIGEMIVHNTDSSMVDLHIDDPKEAVRRGLELAKEVSDLFPPPLRMEFEKAMRLLCIRKKMYAAALIDKQGNHNLNPDKVMKKGILPARRDKAKWIRKIYIQVLMNILTRKSIVETFDLIVDSIRDLLAGKVDYKELLVIRQLGAHYKSETFAMKIFSDYLRRHGKIVNPGDRLEYLIVKGEGENVGPRMRSPELYLERLGTPEEEEIDYQHYVVKVAMNPIDQLFSIGFKGDLEKMTHLGYKPKRGTFKPITYPVKMLSYMIKDDRHLEEAKEIIRPKPVRLKIVPERKVVLKIISN